MISVRRKNNDSVNEYHLSDAEFKFIQDVVREKTGIYLSEQKRSMVYSRLSRRIRTLKLEGFKDYCNLIKSGDDEEIIEMVNAITTNVTHFFRENHHFDFLKDTILPKLYQDKTQRVRFWSAGCSSGQEPYSIAMTILENQLPAYCDLKILATDLSTDILAKAKDGIYNKDAIKDMQKNRELKFFNYLDKEKTTVQIKDNVKDLISFKQLNLMDKWPFKGPFQVIFCRNVIIYFQKDTQYNLFKKFAQMLVPGGYLILGHSEHVFDLNDTFQPIAKTIYQYTGKN